MLGWGGPPRSSFCWTNGGIAGDGWGVLKGRPIRTDFSGSSRILLVFTFIPKLCLHNVSVCLEMLLQPGRDVNSAARLPAILLCLPVVREVSAAVPDFHTGRVSRGAAVAFVKGCGRLCSDMNCGAHALAAPTGPAPPVTAPRHSQTHAVRALKARLWV